MDGTAGLGKGMAKIPSGSEISSANLDDRIGGAITAATRASAVAMRIPRLRVSRPEHRHSNSLALGMRCEMLRKGRVGCQQGTVEPESLSPLGADVMACAARQCKMGLAMEQSCCKFWIKSRSFQADNSSSCSRCEEVLGTWPVQPLPRWRWPPLQALTRQDDQNVRR